MTSLTTARHTAGEAEPRAASARGEQAGRLLQQYGAPIVLLLVAGAGAVVFDGFASGANLANLAVGSSFLAIIAVGMTFVIISGGIDLSVGSQFALGGVLAAWASQYGWAAALALPLAVCGAIGLAQGWIIARTGMAPFIVTLAGLLGARGLMLAISHEGASTYLVKSDVFAKLGQGKLLGLSYPVYIALLLFVAGGLLLQRGRIGQHVFAVGGSEDAARLMGVPVARTKILVYLMTGLLAGLAGALNAARLSSGVTILGTGMELDVIAGVVIGGTLLTGGAGALSGTLAGVLLLGVIQNIINQIGSLTSAYQQVVSGTFLAVVVVVQRYLSRVQRLT
jgi:galactofuranose transport system permease protein